MREPATPAISAPRSERRLLVAALLLALAGAGLSVALTRLHVLTHTDAGYSAVCAVSERFDCNTVALSPFADFAGLPVSVWGLCGYLLIAGLCGWGLSRRAADGWPSGMLFAAASLAAVASAALGAVSWLKIGSTCLFCLGTYLVSGLLLGLSLALLARQRRSPPAALAADLRRLAASPRLTAAMITLALAAVLALEAAVPAYWRHLPWRELPALAQGIDAEGHHWIGAERPLVTIVEFSDYECPTCRRVHRALRETLGGFRDTVRLVHRHYPLDSACNPAIEKPFHRYACRLAQAVECAGEQGRFWEMNDAVFGTQDTNPAARVDPEQLAVELGLDRGQFAACLGSAGPGTRIGTDAAAGQARGVAGTPTFYAGDQTLPLHVSRQVLRALVDAAGAGRR